MAFRKIDVDPFNDDEKWIDNTANMAISGPANESEIRSAISRCVASFT
jgi:hypothetical protein